VTARALWLETHPLATVRKGFLRKNADSPNASQVD
jgi:hypothetical protein